MTMNCITRRGRGILVAFEGCDRSGKSTQCQKLVEYLKSIGRDVVHLRFPGNSFYPFYVLLGTWNMKVQ